MNQLQTRCPKCGWDLWFDMSDEPPEGQCPMCFEVFSLRMDYGIPVYDRFLDERSV